MSDFFEFPEPEPVAERERRISQPPWMSAPPGWLAGAIGTELLLARTDRVAVAVTRLGAYPVGFEFDLVVLAADGEEYELDPMLHGPMHRPGRPPAAAKQAMLRFGIEFADGARVTNVAGREHWQHDREPDGPVLRTGGGYSGSGEWVARMWAWPLPPAGPLTFVCEWPAVGLQLTRVEIDAKLVLDAATRAQHIFEHTDDSPGGAITISAQGSAGRSRPAG